MKRLEARDARLLEAAEGWIGLGNLQEAETELERIASERKNHPDVLRLRWHILAAEGKWVAAAQVARALCTVAPDHPLGWICLAYTAYRLQHTAEAREVLLTVVDEFPADYTIRYDLACYSCLLGKLGEAWNWLRQAMALPHSASMDRLALQDPNLEPLWRAVRAER